jgi:hypothetical protein
MRLAFGLFTAAGALALLHCSSLPDTCHGAACDAVPDGSTAEGGTDGGADVVQPPAGCDASADPKNAPACVVDGFGVFVDATAGNDANPGTKASPVKTITAAVGKVGNKPRVYVCEGTYAEHVKLASAVSVYGGFACSSWSYSGTKVKVAPTDKGFALEVRGVSTDVVLSDLDVTAKDATGPSESSVAAFVVSTMKATFRRTSLTAGKGGDGADGAAAADFAPANAPDGTVGSAAVNPGGQTPNLACATSIGGAGGTNATPNGAAGVVAVAPVYPLGNSGVGGTGGGNCAVGLGTDGSYGIAGLAGAGATALGTLDANGWKGADGAPGGSGGNGQGGGGGAQRVAGGIGGSGGPGGCGGGGGAKGTAGGSSIALLVFESAVALEQVTLAARDAGRGGNAGKGQKAQLASTTNPAPNSGATACAGGIGGVGGSGGGGGGGAGGVSVGILYKGTAPTVDGAFTTSADTLSSTTLGAKGTAGTKGLGGDAAQAAPLSRAGQDGADGAPGQAKAVVSAP